MPSEASQALEMGAEAVLINSAIALAENPALMAKAMKNAVITGRQSFLAGRMKKTNFAIASSPKVGIIGDNNNQK